MRTILSLVVLALALALAVPNTVSAKNDTKVNGTTGTPLGGFGAGGVKFNGNEGTFAIMTRPPADAYDFKEVDGAAFQFFAKRGQATETVDQMKTVVIDGRPDDDAIWPLHRINFGTINDVHVAMTGFSPLDNEDYDNMSLPYAFYEVTLTNTKTSNVAVSIGLQWNSENEPFQFVPGKGITNSTRTVFASAKGKVNITGGNAADPGFLANGVCNNAVNQNQAKVALALDLKANETRVVKFVISWYETVDPDLAYYFNLYDNSETIAVHGLKQFDHFFCSISAVLSKSGTSYLLQSVGILRKKYKKKEF
ncbi:GH116 family glycosyl-hydrolase [Mangrovibacterium lignilyticum]|uniref:GH116 family glycosyl-hydrolase n=1 Tax=Mangrovibacterium lignilyticum TaxID=2668052 RepID=UPI0013D429F5|nr:GH116 family glycosyl-hydrolase [Mangrovibacterium lignilyticum]